MSRALDDGLMKAPVLLATVSNADLLRVWRAAVETPRGCWEWKPHQGGHAYGRMWVRRKTHYAHRVVYAGCFGPIPKGAVVRHSCDNTRCVRPGHLLLGRQKDNIRDAIDRGRFNQPTRHRKKTQCKAGHAFTPENTSIRKSDGAKVCLACHRRRASEYRRVAREKAA